MDDPKSSLGELQPLLRAERELLLEQISGAWQLRLETVLEQLESGWRAQLAELIGGRFAGLEERAAAEMERMASERAAGREPAIRAEAARRITDQLCQAARRLEQAEDSSAWAAALLDGAQLYASRVLLLELTGDRARVAGARGLSAEAQSELDGWSAERPWPPSLQGAADGQDTVIALASESELSTALFTALAGADGSLSIAVPVIAGRTERKRRAAAILLAVGEQSELHAPGLELLAAAAGATHDCRIAAQRATTTAPAGVLLGIGTTTPAPPSSQSMPWREEEWHARAQRFARVKVAEIRLYRPEAVLAGRASKDLYGALRTEIDRGREEYQQQFGGMAATADYYHEEILRTLAHDDPSLLGPGYPGARL